MRDFFLSILPYKYKNFWDTFATLSDISYEMIKNVNSQLSSNQSIYLFIHPVLVVFHKHFWIFGFNSFTTPHHTPHIIIIIFTKRIRMNLACQFLGKYSLSLSLSLFVYFGKIILSKNQIEKKEK